MINRIVGGSTYADLFTNQQISTPIISPDKIDILYTTPLTGFSQIPNIPEKTTIVAINTTTDQLSLTAGNYFYDSNLAVVYECTGSPITGLIKNQVYYITSIDKPNNFITLSDSLNGSTADLTGTLPAGTHTIRLAFQVPQISEVSLLRLDSTIPGPTTGSLAYGTYTRAAEGTITALDNATEEVTIGATPIAQYSVGLEVVYTASASAIGGLTSGNTYFISAVDTASNEVKLSTTKWGSAVNLTGALPAGTHLLTPAKTSSLYWYDGTTYDYISLGWPHGSGIYNNDAVFAEAYTGWPHGTGNYTIISTNAYIDIRFDYIDVVEVGSGSRGVVTGVSTNPETQFNIRVVSGAAGINSIDAGIRTTDTGYWVYIVYNPDDKTYGGVFSLNSSVPSLPTNYTFFQRLGWVRSDSNGNFTPSVQVNKQFSFLTKPNVANTLTTAASGVSSQTIINLTTLNSANYPNPQILDKTDIVVQVTTTAATTTERVISLFSSTLTDTYHMCMVQSNLSAGNSQEFIFNDVPVDRNITLNVNQSAADTSTTVARLQSFKFNDSLLY